jgi:glyoxylase-like metal-dependent hydrolase (beta-lactamase superfamily II)
MARMKALFWLLVLSVWGHAQAITLSPLEVAPHVYAFIGDTGMRSYENEGMNANAGFIVTSAGVVVVDSGPSYQVAKAMHDAIRKVTRQPVKFVINSGGQDHRWLGNSYFKSLGAEIIASRKARVDMEARGAMELEALRETSRDKLAGTEMVYPTKLFDQSETLKLGGEEIQILYFGGGHTPGDSVVWLPKSRVLFSGDVVFVDRMLGVLPFGSTRDWLVSFDKAMALTPKTIVPGHGQICDPVRARKDTRDYLALLRGHMKKALDDGLDLQAAISSLDQGAFKYLRHYEMLSGGNANRTYLEMESE